MPASASIAPCRMNAAAILSTSTARLAVCEEALALALRADDDVLRLEGEELLAAAEAPPLLLAGGTDVYPAGAGAAA